jgi:hypothetical protein
MLPLWLLGLLALALAVDAGALYHIHLKMRIATDAGALAAALASVDDRSLIDSVDARAQVFQNARLEGIGYSLANGVSGSVDNLASQQNAVDVFFDNGYDTPAGIPFGPNPHVVRVVGYRTSARSVGVPLLLPQFFAFGPLDVVVGSTALIDRRIVGFRPLPSRPVPLVPIAILSDPSGKNPMSWEYQISAAPHDNVAFDPSLRQFVPDAGDGLPEIVLTIPQSAVPLIFTSTGDLARQIVDGLAPQDLESLGGSLIPSSSGLPVPVIGSSDLEHSGGVLGSALETVRVTGEPRVWPLFQPSAATGGSITISGFVAARVVAADSSSPIKLWLQPAALATSTALTARDLIQGTESSAAPISLNPYIAKVRLIE